MKIIFLNAWEGKVKDKLAEFIKEQKESTDVFCFQETDGEFRPMFSMLLSGYNEFLGEKYIDRRQHYYQATYVKKKLKTLGPKIISKDNLEIGLGLIVEVKNKNKVWQIANVHGLAYPGDKLDSAERLEQSKEIIKSFDIKESVVIGGDFNLEKATESVRMFTENGYCNLIEEFRIKTTRNKLAWEGYQTKQYFADYVFVSPKVKVKSFRVPNLEVSDHLPLILEVDN